jgi:quercetin dioxygenase-like cupin family protein
MTDQSFFRICNLDVTEMLPGIQRRAVWLDRVMLTFFTFQPGSVVPEHAHDHEQITVVTRGAMTFSLGGEVCTLRAGEGVCIPPNVRHGARILNEETEAYDAWSPPRDDYKALFTIH